MYESEVHSPINLFICAILAIPVKNGFGVSSLEAFDEKAQVNFGEGEGYDARTPHDCQIYPGEISTTVPGSHLELIRK